MHYSPETVYFIAYSRLSKSIPAGKLLDVVGVGLIIHQETGVIEDTSCTLLTDEAKLFLKDLIVGFNIHTHPIEELLDYVCSRYHGMSQKAVCVAIRDACERYIQWKNE
ncbi:MAG: DUF3870 domain-containing protein [Clostridiales bacterium]|nr:DUF3870 domain-containing protein [Clostridiales bacterium]